MKKSLVIIVAVVLLQTKLSFSRNQKAESVKNMILDMGGIPPGMKVFTGQKVLSNVKIAPGSNHKQDAQASKVCSTTCKAYHSDSPHMKTWARRWYKSGDGKFICLCSTEKDAELLKTTNGQEIVEKIIGITISSRGHSSYVNVDLY